MKSFFYQPVFWLISVKHVTMVFLLLLHMLVYPSQRTKMIIYGVIASFLFSPLTQLISDFSFSRPPLYSLA